MSARIASRARAAIACVLLATAVAGCGGGGNAKPDVPQAPSALPEGRLPVVFDAGRYGYSGPARDRTLDQIVTSGADTARLLLSWSEVAPAERPGGFDPADPADPAYDFSVYDDFLRAAEERNLGLLITIGGPAPAWASNGNRPGVDPSPAEFGRFTQAVAERYGGGFDPEGEDGDLPAADLWSVWNEPNLSLFLEPQYRDGKPYSPALYRRLFLAAQSALKAAGSEAPLLIGETAPTGSTDSVDPIPFARGVMCLTPHMSEEASCESAEIGAVGWATHPYGVIGQAPFEPPPTDQFVTIDSLERLEQVLDEGAAAGQVRDQLPVYITEYGVQSEPDPLAGVPLDSQAEYLGIAERLAYADPRVKSWAQYLLRDDPPAGGPPAQAFAGFESGLQFSDGTPKPAYDAFQLPLTVRRSGDDVTLWGLVRPSTEAERVELWVIDGGRPRRLRSLRTEPDGTFEIESRWRRGRLWQLRWPYEEDRELRGVPVRAYSYPLPG